LRHIALEPAKSVICLYDVVGSFAVRADDANLMASIARHVQPGGTLLLSVMNYVLTEAQAVNKFTFADEPNRILSLPPSQNMETTGEVFDPGHYLVDTDEHVVYRLEQFRRGDAPPAELLVRDRRYTRAEIEQLCGAVGLDVIWSRHVHAGHWEKDLDPCDPEAKEILVFCRKRD
jgi:SAM-dependent methyltransferase